MLREGLTRLAGVEGVSPNADRKSWTCSMRTARGRLPDLRAMAAGIAEMGQGARLRGVEVTAEGQLVERGGALALQLPGQPPLHVAPLTEKVQWDVAGKCRQAPTAAERGARDQLAAAWPKRRGQWVRITGPLVARGEGSLSLEVRVFAWLPAGRGAGSKAATAALRR